MDAFADLLLMVYNPFKRTLNVNKCYWPFSNLAGSFSKAK